MEQQHQNYNIYIVVDDCSVNRRIISKFIDKLDSNSMVIDCDNGQDAIEACIGSWDGNYKIKAIIMDYMMPGMDGVEAIKRIADCYKRRYKSEFSASGIACNILTAHTDFTEADLNMLGVGVYYKPVTNKVVKLLMGIPSGGAR